MGKKQVAKILRVGKLILGAALLLVIFSDQKSRRQNQKTAEEAREELVLAEATSPAVVAEDLFEKWSILENDNVGYRLAYPAEFKLNSDFDNKAEFYPPSGPGKITLYIKGSGMELKVLDSGADRKQKKILSVAEKLIKETFEFTKNEKD